MDGVGEDGCSIGGYAERETGADRRSVGRLLAVIARQERVRLSERTLTGLQRAKAHGRVGSRPRTEHE
jgi:DNA invertase Pin-like site-specific DNA recombinase